MNKLPILLLVSAAAFAASPAYAGDAAAGKTKAEAACADCHGDDGKGDDKVPAVAGLSVEKFNKAILEFQNGTRTKSAKMTKEAKKLSPADVANLAAYCQTLK